MKSKIIFTPSLEEVRLQINATIQEAFKPTLAVVFASQQCDLTQLCKIFNDKQITVIGSTTAGEIGNSAIQNEGITILLLDLDPAYFKVIQKNATYDNSFVVGEEIAQIAKASFINPAFILVFSMVINGEKLVEGISNQVGGYPPIFGGMAGDEMKMIQSYTFTNEGIGHDLATILILDNDRVSIEGLALCGWQPIGIENTITKASDNIIYEINEEPALDVVKRYFGDYFDNSMDQESVPLGAAQYPLQIAKNDHFVLRAALDANEKDGSLFMAGPITQGDTFRFSVAPGFEVIDQTIEGYKKFYKQQPEADALLMFSCVARHMSLGPLIEDEIEGIYNIWNKPMIGFFTYGEVGQEGKGTSHFYNETCSLVLLRERV